MPDEIADAAVFLADNEYANNCVINLDGGLSAVSSYHPASVAQKWRPTSRSDTKGRRITRHIFSTESHSDSLLDGF